MLRAMDSAVAGLRSHQNKMDVVGHNIANVNTFGFKAQTYTFKEAMYQTSAPSTANEGGAGGSNAAQYGYGTLMGSIGMDMTASTPSYVGGFNASIDGDGFFITCMSILKKNTGVDSTNAGIKAAGFDFSRVGQFLIDSEGYMVDANNHYIYGFRSTEVKDGTLAAMADRKLEPLRIPSALTGDVVDDVPGSAWRSVDVEIDKMGVVKAKITDPDDPTQSGNVILGTVAIATFQNPNGLTKAGENYYTTNTHDNTGVSMATAPGDAGTSTLMTGFIEASNVDLAKEFADMITTHRGFQANSKMITVSDEMLSDLVAMKR